MATRFQQAPSRYEATHSRVAKGTSHESTSRSTAAPHGHRQSSSTTLGRGPGGTGGSSSISLPATTRSSSAPGTPPPPPSPRTSERCGTRRATSTTLVPAFVSAPSQDLHVCQRELLQHQDGPRTNIEVRCADRRASCLSPRQRDEDDW